MNSKHRQSIHWFSPLLAMTLWCACPTRVWPQSITATIPVGSASKAVAINKVTNRIYVADFLGATGVTVIDGTTHSTTTVPAGFRPLAMAVNEVTNKIYVVNEGGIVFAKGSITVIDGVTNASTTVVDPHAVGPRSLAVNPSTNKIYVANLFSGNVTVIDGATNSTTTVTDPHVSGLGAVALAVNSVTNRIYVVNNNTDRAVTNPGNVTVIDGATNLTTTITDPKAFFPSDVAVNAVTNKIYVANAGDYPSGNNHGNVTVIDGGTNVTTTITDPNALNPGGVDSRGFAVAVDSTTNKIYVTNEGSNNITVIDGATNSTTTVTDPNALFPVAAAVDEATNTVYVANGGCGFGNGCSNPGSVTVINGGTNSVTTLIDPKASAPDAVAVNPITNQIYVANGSSNVTIIGGSVPATAHTVSVLLAGNGGGTVTSNPVGINCGTSCAASFATGTAVRLIPSSSPGSEFSGWSGPCTGTSSCDVTADADQFVTATFNSTGPMQVAVPNVLGQTQAAAATAIAGVGLVVGTVTQQSSSTVVSGEVSSESPAAGTNVASGSAVNFVVSTGGSSGGSSGGSGGGSSGGSGGGSSGGSGGGGAFDWLTLGALLGFLCLGLRRSTHERFGSLRPGKSCLAVIIVLVAPHQLFGQVPPARPTSYAVENLGTLGGTQSAAYGINNEGWVTGAANLPGDQNEHPFLWREGTMIDLGTPGGPNGSAGFPFKNDRGLVAAFGQTSTTDPLGETWNFYCTVSGNLCEGTNLIQRGFLWVDGFKVPMPTLGGNNNTAVVANNLGQVVGFAETATVDPNCVAPQVLDYEAVIWTPWDKRIQELPPYPGDSIGAAIGINDRGQVVGTSGACGPATPAVGAHALLWQDGVAIYLGSLGGATDNLAYAINDRGQVVGVSDLPGDTTAHAFFWQNGTMTDLGTLPGDVFSVAFSINNHAQVVGQSCDVNFNCRALLWQDGVMTDLNTLTPPGSPLYLLSANDLNDHGEIVGQAFNQSDGSVPAFLLVPTKREGEAVRPNVQTSGRVLLAESIRSRFQQGRGLMGLGR